MDEYHLPVLLKESVDGLNIQPGGIYVDATFGGGGHSAEILKRMKRGRLYAFDQDEDASHSVPDDKRFIFILGNFRFLQNYLKYYGVTEIDGLLADLGVSSHHFNEPGRGFTYREDAPLDMRMNRSASLNASEVLNTYDAEQLERVFREYGEFRQYRQLAGRIINARQNGPVTTTGQLVECLSGLIPKQVENQFLSRIFQAIRIEVNREMDSLEHLLNQSFRLLKPGGRLAVISYHSLEDRMVKNFTRWGNTSGQPQADLYGHVPEPFVTITRKPIAASEQEIKNNPRSRSARLRIAEKK